MKNCEQAVSSKKDKENQILDVVNNLLKKADNYRLDNGNIDVVKLAKSYGFLVYKLKKDAPLKGLIISDIDGDDDSKNGDRIIAFDSTLSEKDNRFIIAHELGHYFLHRKTPDFTISGKFVNAYHYNEKSKNESLEEEADFFAANLLLPESAFREKWKEFGNFAGTDFGYEALSNYFLVSVRCVKKRAEELHVL